MVHFLTLNFTSCNSHYSVLGLLPSCGAGFPVSLQLIDPSSNLIISAFSNLVTGRLSLPCGIPNPLRKKLGIHRSQTFLFFHVCVFIIMLFFLSRLPWRETTVTVMPSDKASVSAPCENIRRKNCPWHKMERGFLWFLHLRTGLTFHSQRTLHTVWLTVQLEIFLSM